MPVSLLHPICEQKRSTCLDSASLRTSDHIVQMNRRTSCQLQKSTHQIDWKGELCFRRHRDSEESTHAHEYSRSKLLWGRCVCVDEMLLFSLYLSDCILLLIRVFILYFLSKGRTCEYVGAAGFIFAVAVYVCVHP